MYGGWFTSYYDLGELFTCIAGYSFCQVDFYLQGQNFLQKTDLALLQKF